ncbi:MAG: hypothetical protein ACF8QF_06350 [Phycisphaerales bacterium]
MKSALAANAIGKAASTSLTIGVAGAVGVAGVVIPLRMSGALGPADAKAEAPADIAPADPDRALIHAGLKELVESAGALIAAHDASGVPAHAVFWRADTHDLGVVNADEIFVLAHHRLLETVVAYAWEGETRGERIDSARLFSDAFFGAWRRSPSVEATVVGAGVPDMRLTWRAQDVGNGELTVRLIWGHASADESDERREAGERASVFTAQVPALRRVR